MYIIIGTFILIFSGLVYAWTTLAAPIQARFPEWSEAQISLTFTIVMSGFCIGGLLGGILQKKMKPYVVMWISGVLLLLVCHHRDLVLLRVWHPALRPDVLPLGKCRQRQEQCAKCQ